MQAEQQTRNESSVFKALKNVSPYLFSKKFTGASLVGALLLQSTLSWATPSSVQTRRTFAAGAAGDGGEASHFQFLEWTGRTSWFEYRTALETRHVSADASPSIREPKHARPSLSLRNKYFRLMLGNRYLPGPRTRFLSHPVFYSGFARLPDPRETDSFFIHPGGGFFGSYPVGMPLPGLFALKGYKTPGLFAANDSETLLAAWHFKARRGVLALDKTWNAGEYSGRIRGDLIAHPRTVTGNLDFNALPSPDAKWSPRIASEWERRAHWDAFRLRRHGTDTPSRPGKSGLGSVRLEWRPAFVLEAAGQDRGLTGMRLAGALLRLGGDSGGRILARGRAYGMRHYGNDDKGNAIPPQKDAGGALGYALSRRHAGFRVLYEERRQGPPAGELAFWIRARGFEFTLEAVFGPPREGFLFLRAHSRRGLGARFHPARAGALVMRVKSESFYFYLSSTATKSRPEHYANLQFKLEL